MVDVVNYDNSKQTTTHYPLKKKTQSLLKPNIQAKIKWNLIKITN